MVFPGERLELEHGRETGRAAGHADAGAWQFALRTPRGDLAITHGVAEFET